MSKKLWKLVQIFVASRNIWPLGTYVKLQYSVSVIDSAIWQIFFKFTFLFQLKDENDYYYTVFNQKKKAREDGIDLRKGRRFFFGEEESDDENEDKVIWILKQVDLTNFNMHFKR